MKQKTKPAKKEIRKVDFDFGTELLKSVREFHDAVASRQPGKLTVRQVKRIPPPPVLKSRQVSLIREQLDLSQFLFAHVVGVSPQLVRAWEQGTRKPSKLACRLLEEIRRNPDYWRKKVSSN